MCKYGASWLPSIEGAIQPGVGGVDLTQDILGLVCG